MAKVFIGLLGGFRARQTGGDDIAFTTRKSRLLLAFLAMPAGEPHSRERLSALLWGDRGEEQARGSLRNALTSLRRAVGADAIRVDKDMIFLDPRLVEVDVARLESLLRQGAEASLAEARQRYRGRLLEGFSDGEGEFDDWLRTERARIDDLVVRGFYKLLDHYVAIGAHGDAVATARAILSIDPLQEAVYRQLMRLHADYDERPQALRVFDELTRVLASELAVEPDAESRALAEVIRENRPTASAAPPPETAIEPPAAAKPADAPSDASARPSIAVLSFETLGSADQDYFADGIVEEITAALSRVRTFFVNARSSAMSFRNSGLPAAAVADKLGVRYLLTGTVRRSRERVRLGAQLIEASTGRHLWSDQFEGNIGDVFDLQDRITEEVVGILQPTILAAEIARARRKRPENLRAYDLVLRAFPHCWALKEDDNARALDLLREAIRLDPGYALAYALISWCHAQSITYNWTGDIQPAKERALARAREAFELDNGDPLVLSMLGTAESLAADHAMARIHIDRALSLDRNSAWAWLRSGWINTYVGRFERAIEDFERSWRLSPYDPLNFNLCFGMGLAHFGLEKYEKALRFIEQGLLENPTAIWARRPLAAFHAVHGHKEEAARAVAAILERHPHLTAGKIIESLPHRDPGLVRRYYDALVLAGFEP